MTTRRQMLRSLATAVAGLAIAPRSRASGEAAPTDAPQAQAADTTSFIQATVSLSKVKELAKVGGSAVVTVNGRTLLLARNTETSVLAFESRCTHKQVTLKYDHKNLRLNCPAHGSRFDLQGVVTRGPAAHNLATYRASLKGDDIIIWLPK